MNNALRDLYQSRIGDLFAALNKLVNQYGLNNLSNPHLIKVPPAYEKAQVKLLIVGQQAREWGGYFNGQPTPQLVDNLMKVYETFELGKSVPSPFWQAAHEIYARVNPDGPAGGFVWTNVIKIDQDGQRPIPPVVEACLNTFGLLPEEIEILKPDVVVFLTGPYYDADLQLLFPGVEFRSVCQDIPIHHLAQVVHPRLPDKSFRIYHPGYLRRSEQWHYVDKVVALART